MNIAKHILLILTVIASTLSTTVQADGLRPDDIITEPLTPEGNAILVDDIMTDEKTGKQFITVMTRNGYYFYIVIDHDDDGNENVHFLNQVDEADLMDILKEEDELTLECICETKCKAGEVNTTCAVCLLEYNGCVGTEPIAPTSKEEKKNNSPIVILLIITAVSVGYYLFRKYRKKQDTEADSLPEEYYDFDDEYTENTTDSNKDDETL